MLAKIPLCFDQRGTGKTKMRMRHMNRLRDYVGIFAICATSVFFTGCGDDDNDSNGGNQGPITVAPQSLNGRTYTLTDGAGTSTLAFDAADTYTLTPGDGSAADSGTFTAQRVGDTWTVQSASTTSTNTATLTLNFSSDTAGNFELRQGDAAPVTGTFAQSSGNPDPDPDPDPDPEPGTAPASLSTITVMPSGGGSYTITFTGTSSGTFAAMNSEGGSMGSGNFTYTPNGDQAHLRLDYAGTETNEFDDMTLTFQPTGSAQPHTFTGTQKIGTITSAFTGTFTL
jgi:hypothetical protein